MEHIKDWASPGDSVVKNPPANAGNRGSIPGTGRFPGEGNGNPFQYSCLENLMDKGAWVGHALVTKPPPHYQHI